MTQALAGHEDQARIASAAMRMLDKILAENPEKNGHDLSEAARSLTALRDALIAERRAAGPNREADERLMLLNAVISAVVGAHFPIGAIPWKSVEAARDAFAKLICGNGAAR